MSKSKFRKQGRRGATLTLVVACVFLIAIIGIAFFVIIKILGGSAEVNNTTEAGILNVAKNSLTKITVDVDGDLKYTIAPAKNVNLLNYNRLVAHAILVGLNAETLGPTAQANAKILAEQVIKIGKELDKRLGDEGILADWFTDLTYRNNTKLWNGNKVNPQDITALALRKGGSTNITLHDNLPEEAQELPSVQHGKDKYLAGYEALKFGLVAVPVFPSQRPHLVDPREKELELKNVPSNAFRVRAMAGVGDTGMKGGSLAAAIVGCVDTSSNFPVSIPAGYIEIVNLPGSELPSSWRCVSNEDNLFNNELYFPPGVTVSGCTVAVSAEEGNWSASGYPCIFSQDEKAVRELTMWARMKDKADQGEAVTVPPLPSSFSYPVYLAYAENEKGSAVSCPPTEHERKQLMKMAVSTREISDKKDDHLSNYVRNCLDDLQEKEGLRRGCRTYLGNLAATYHPLPKEGDPYADTPMFSAVDFIKGKVIHNFQQGNGASKDKPAKISIDKITGLGKYPRGPFHPESTPEESLPLQREATINDLLEQVAKGDCDQFRLHKNLYQRVKEIVPSTTPDQMKAILNTKLPMGKTLYIYSPSPGAQVTISETKPPSYSGFVPDSKGELLKCMNEYPLDDVFVNTDALHPKNEVKLADDYVRRKVYMKQEGSFTGYDKASLKLSSGYGNLLGRLEFSNRAEGSAEYWQPN